MTLALFLIVPRASDLMESIGETNPKQWSPSYMWPTLGNENNGLHFGDLSLIKGTGGLKNGRGGGPQ